jgi:hypothetical protein
MLVESGGENICQSKILNSFKAGLYDRIYFVNMKLSYLLIFIALITTIGILIQQKGAFMDKHNVALTIDSRHDC